MITKIIFFAAVSAATLAVILLAVVSPLPRKSERTHSSRSWLSLSLSPYIQPPHLPNPRQDGSLHANSAFIFQQKLTEGPKNTSRVIGKAQGIIVPTEHSALSAFNIIYLTFDTPEYSGSLSLQAKRQAAGHGTREEDEEEEEEEEEEQQQQQQQLTVVGGTGSFAFARGLAVFSPAEGPSQADATHRLILRLRLPVESGALPG